MKQISFENSKPFPSYSSGRTVFVKFKQIKGHNSGVGRDIAVILSGPQFPMLERMYNKFHLKIANHFGVTALDGQFL